MNDYLFISDLLQNYDRYIYFVSGNKSSVEMLRLIDIPRKFIQVESAKYKSKGAVNVALSYFLLFMLYYIAPYIGNAVWPDHIQDVVSFQFKIQALFSVFLTFLFMFIYLPGYMGVKWYKKYETSPNLKRPWEKPDWKSRVFKTIFLYILNKGIIFPLYIYCILKLFTVKLDFSKQNLPSSWEMFSTMIKVQLVDDFAYMWVHRAFHQFPFLYKYHKVHHGWETGLSIIGEYCHPVQQIFANILPATISFSIFKTHAFTFFFWTCYKLYTSSQAHSGYEFPWSPFRILPFVYGPSYHEYHHTANNGNYSANMYFVEMIIGTNKPFIDSQMKRINGVTPQPVQKAKNN